MKTRIFKDKHGLSLVEIMVAIGVLGIISVVMATMFGNLIKMSSTLQSKFEMVNHMGYLQTLMDTPEVCTANFKGKEVNTLTLNIKQITNDFTSENFKLFTKDPAGVYNVIIAAKDHEVGKIYINNMELTLKEQHGTLFLGEILFEFQAKVPLVGINTFVERLPIALNIPTPGSNAVIESCNGTSRVQLFPVALTTLNNYNSMAPDVCGDLGDISKHPSYTAGGWMFLTDACNRFCTMGCRVGIDGGCTVTSPGMGYAIGSAGGCSGVTGDVACLCVR